MNLEDFLKETFTYKRYELELAWIDFRIKLFRLDSLKHEREKLINKVKLFLKEE